MVPALSNLQWLPTASLLQPHRLFLALQFTILPKRDGSLSQRACFPDTTTGSHLAGCTIITLFPLCFPRIQSKQPRNVFENSVTYLEVSVSFSVGYSTASTGYVIGKHWHPKWTARNSPGSASCTNQKFIPEMLPKLSGALHTTGQLTWLEVAGPALLPDTQTSSLGSTTAALTGEWGTQLITRPSQPQGGISASPLMRCFDSLTHWILL